MNIIEVLKLRVKDEYEAIRMYASDLDNSEFTDDEKKIIKEILEDEKDHLVLLTAMIEDRGGESMIKEESESSFDIDDEVVIEKTSNAEKLIRWIETNLGLSDPAINDEDNTYTYTLSDSKVYGRIYSKLEKLTSVVEVRSSSMTTDDYASIHYKRTVDPRFTMNLLGDFKNDEYSLIVVEE